MLLLQSPDVVLQVLLPALVGDLGQPGLLAGKEEGDVMDFEDVNYLGDFAGFSTWRMPHRGQTVPAVGLAGS